MRSTFLILLLALASSVFAQDKGPIAPSIYPVFTNLNGVTPVASGFVCTTASGGSTPKATFSNSTLSAGLANPISLNSSGRAVTGSTLVSIYLTPGTAYRFTLYAAGSSNTCNGSPVGSMIWQRDGIYGPGITVFGGTAGTTGQLVKFTGPNEIGDSVVKEVSGSPQLIVGSSTHPFTLGVDEPWIVNVGIGGETAGFAAATATSNASTVSLAVVPGSKASLITTATGAGTLLPFTIGTAVAQMHLEAADPTFVFGTNTITSTDWTDTGSAKIAAVGAAAKIGAITGNDDASVFSIGVVTGSEAQIVSSITGGAAAVLPLVFYMGSTAQMRLDDSDPQLFLGDTTTDLSLSTDAWYVAIGATAAAGFAATTGPTNASTLSLSVTTGGEVSLVAGKTGSGTYQPITLYTNGSLRSILSTAGAWRWHAYGAGTLTTDASGNITAVSDERLKELIEPFHGGLDVVSKITPISYNWNGSSGMDRDHRYVGFSAQDMQRALPSAVGQMQNGMLTLQDRPILAVTINALKELEARVKALEAR